jgi:hypothetical protein
MWEDSTFALCVLGFAVVTVLLLVALHGLVEPWRSSGGYRVADTR